MTYAVVVMGVSGCGKSSVGRALAVKIGYHFVDADDLHPAANVSKMRAGTPLTDEDRWPWLAAVEAAIRQRLDQREGIVMACSALKRSYRDRLRGAGPTVRFVHLAASPDLIEARLTRRKEHFFDPKLLASQFAALETPDPSVERDVIVLDASAPLDQVVEHATAAVAPSST